MQNAKVLVGHIDFKFTDNVFIRSRECRTGCRPVDQIRGRLKYVIIAQPDVLRHLDRADVNCNCRHKRWRGNYNLGRIGVTRTGVDNVDGGDNTVGEGGRGRGAGAATALNRNQRSIRITAAGIRDGGSHDKIVV